MDIIFKKKTNCDGSSSNQVATDVDISIVIHVITIIICVLNLTDTKRLTEGIQNPFGYLVFLLCTKDVHRKSYYVIHETAKYIRYIHKTLGVIQTKYHHKKLVANTWHHAHLYGQN